VRTRKKLIALALALAAISACIAVALRDREPRYQGQPLSYWIHRYSHQDERLGAIAAPGGGFHPHPVPPDKEAAEAFRQIDTNAIPLLLEWIAYEPSLIRVKADVLLDKLPDRWTPKFLNRAEERSFDAANAFRALGTNATSAIPALTAMAAKATDEDAAMLYAKALAFIGPTALPSLLTLCTNGPVACRSSTIAAIPFLGPDALPAVPMLVAALNDTNTPVACCAAADLGELGLAPELCIVPLANLVKSPDPVRREAAADALIEFGQPARIALPQLYDLTHDPDTDVRKRASMVLIRIDHDAFINATPDHQ
jgi:HEAT repeat protein